MLNTKKILFLILLLIFTVWTGILCFYRLGEAGTHNWDEARHIVNAYEMMKSGSWWIHTYLGETDYYNFKPPLSMWFIIGGFKLFGISFYSMRLYSAISMLILMLLMTLFLCSSFGKRAGVLFAVLFVSGTELFFFHMARSADADALYILLFAAAMLCLYFAEERQVLLIPCGFFLSLAFLTKCFHVAVGVAIVILYLPRFYKKLKIWHYAGALTAFCIPIGIWAAIRYTYDGTAFFAGMLGQEVVERVITGKDYLAYLSYYASKPMLMLTFAAILLSAVVLWKSGRLLYHRLYLFFLWFGVPFIVYSLSGAFLEWYSYVCYIPFYVIAAAFMGEVTALRKKYWAVWLILLLPLGGAVFQVKEAWEKLHILSYENNTDIRKDMETLIREHPEYQGTKIYIENSRNEYKPQNVWEQSCVADAYIVGDLIPADGGVPIFIEDQESILIISKNLFETYSGVLTGRVILVDGKDYLIFCNDFYG